MPAVALIPLGRLHSPFSPLGPRRLSSLHFIEAILQGQRDPRILAALRDPKCKNDAEAIAKALECTWRPEHLFALRQAYEPQLLR